MVLCGVGGESWTLPETSSSLSPEHDTVHDTALAGFVGAYVKGLLVKYWILVCSAMFFVVSFNGKVAVYKIIYIFLFLSWVALYQVSDPLPAVDGWTACVHACMCVCLSVYLLSHPQCP